MPPMKKRTKSAKANIPTPADVLSAKEMKKQLEDCICQLREELDMERNERNCLQLYCDKVLSLLDLTQKQLEEKKADLRKSDRAMKEAEERHRVEINLYKQKVTQLNLKNEKDRAELRGDFERCLKEVEASHEIKMGALRQEQDLKRKSQIRDAEKRKNSHIQRLVKNHEKAYGELNDINQNNLALVATLQKQVSDMKQKEEVLVKDMDAINMQNKCLTEKATKDASVLQKWIYSHKHDRALLVGAKTNLKMVEKELKALKWENGVLEQGFRKVQQERDELYQITNQHLLQLQQKTSAKSLLLEKWLEALNKVTTITSTPSNLFANENRTEPVM